MRVPITVDRIELAELASLGIDFTPKIWTKKTRVVNKVKRAFDYLERAYLEEVVNSDKNSPLSRTTTKLYESLKYFRRSFRPSSEVGERYVSLAIAFETMLIDGGNFGAGKKIALRLAVALKGIPRAEAMVRSVRRVSLARNEVVHSGFVETHVNMGLAQKAFTECFLVLCRKLTKLKFVEKSSAPIGELLGFHPDPDDDSVASEA